MNDAPNHAPNYFEQVGEQQARKHAHRVANIKADKEQRDEQVQFKLYRRANRVALTALLANPVIGDKVSALVKFLKTLGPESAPTLVDYIDRSEWLKRAEQDVREQCLSIISNAIMKVRLQQGLPPFDDSLGDEPLTAFQRIRLMLVGV